MGDPNLNEVHPSWYNSHSHEALPLYLNACLLFSSIFKNKTAYHFAIRESSCDPNIKQMWLRQLVDCYRFSLESLSEVTVSDLEMCHLGVVGYSIHSPLCARNRGTHSWQCVQEKSGWQGSIHNLQQVEGSESNAEDREAEDRHCAAAHSRSHVHATRVGVQWCSVSYEYIVYMQVGVCS